MYTRLLQVIYTTDNTLFYVYDNRQAYRMFYVNSLSISSLEQLYCWCFENYNNQNNILFICWKNISASEIPSNGKIMIKILIEFDKASWNNDWAYRYVSLLSAIMQLNWK
jgi:hypothetical protein